MNQYPFFQDGQPQGQQPQQPVNPLPQQMAAAMLQYQQQMAQQQYGQPQFAAPQFAQPFQPGGLLSPITDYESLKLRARGGLFGFGY